MIKSQLVSETHPTVSTGNDMEATGTELTSMLSEIQRFASEGDVRFTFPEEEDGRKRKSLLRRKVVVKVK